MRSYPLGPREIVLQEGFTAEQATRLTGCTSSQLRYWDTVRLVQPSIQKTGGRPGVRRVYSFRDLVLLRAVRSLKDNGMSLQRIRRAWGYLSRNGVDPRTVKLVTDGVSIFQTQEDDGLIDLLRKGQMSFLEALEAITRNVEEDKSLFELNRERFLTVLENTEEEVARRIEAASG